MVSAEVSMAFGAACKLSADLYEALSETHYACCDRMGELGRISIEQRAKKKEFEAALSEMKVELSSLMSKAYLAIYAEELEERAKHD